MCAGICAIVGLMHFLVWVETRQHVFGRGFFDVRNLRYMRQF
jgi:hypothetical protein